ncbi:MAG: TetR/AcrR family transcriptional regulator [Nocardioidaceae bacterium]
MSGAKRLLPSGEPRPRYDADTLLDVAARVFTERGYDGTSMEDLSRASGLSKSSLYHHVASKEEMLRRALERAVDPLFAIIDEPEAQTGAAVDRLRYVIDRAVHVLAERLPYVTLLLRVHGNTETERWALERRRAFDKVIARLVRDAVAAGDLRSDIDAATTARLLLGMVNSLVEWYRPTTRPGDAVDRIAEQITTLTFDGLRA